MHGAFQAILSIDINKVCKLDHGKAALTDDANTLKEMQEQLGRKCSTYGDHLPKLVLDQDYPFKRAAELARQIVDWVTRRFEEPGYKDQVHSCIQGLKQGFPEMMLWADIFSVQSTCDSLLKEQKNVEELLKEKVSAIDAKKKEIEECLQSENEKLGVEREKVIAILNEAKTFAQQGKVSQLAGIYKAQADSHFAANKHWLYGALGSTAGLMGVALFMFWLIPEQGIKSFLSPNHWQPTLAFALLLLPLLALLGAVNLCAKRAAAHAHLHSVFEHKASIAKAFVWMSDTEKDDKLRAEWMKSIVEGLVHFESSGFLGKESGASAPQPITMQVVKEVKDMVGQHQ